MEEGLRRVEIRFELPAEEVQVLDGHCHATGEDRTTVMRRLLREWSSSEHKRAIMICRTAGGNTAAPEAQRKGTGS